METDFGHRNTAHKLEPKPVVPSFEKVRHPEATISTTSLHQLASNPETHNLYVEAELKKRETNLNPAFGEQFYKFRRKFLKFFGGSYDVYDSDGKKVLYGHQDEFKLKEHFHVYPDNKKQDELLSIKTNNIIDAWAKYDVTDTTSGENVGSFKREWLPSIVRDEWTITGGDGKQIGKLREKSNQSAFLTRFLGSLFFPQEYAITTNDGSVVAEINQHRNPFALSYGMQIKDTNPAIDRRLLISSGILLAGIERRQETWGGGGHSSTYGSSSSTT